MVVCRAPERISCMGLGSCVAVILYDPVLKLGGVVHVLLPRAPKNCDKEGKYADSGTRKLIRDMLSFGAKKEHMIAKLVGGAQMFPDLDLTISDIGRQNTMEVRKVLREYSIRIVAEEVAGGRGRSAFFDTKTGRVSVRTAFAPNEKVI